jgi:hypothetical protein
VQLNCGKSPRYRPLDVSRSCWSPSSLIRLHRSIHSKRAGHRRGCRGDSHCNNFNAATAASFNPYRVSHSADWYKPFLQLNWRPDAGRATPSNVRKAAMERCALCRGKLGSGTRFRNIWNGRWWVHVRFCSVRCEGIYEVKRNDAAKQRWHAFLARGNIRS